MIKKIHVIPRPLTAYEAEQYPQLKCAVVRRPVEEGGKPLPIEGAMVPETSYWLRRLKSKDASRGPGLSKAAKKRPAPAAKE